MLGTSAILHGGSQEQKRVARALLLEKVAGFGLEESPHHNPAESHQQLRWRTSSCTCYSKKFVLDGHVADKLVVVARSSGNSGERDGLTLVLVDREADGVSVTRTIMADSRNAANIVFDGAQGVVLGEVGAGADVLDRVLDAGRILLAAEMLGGIQECFERTVDYLKTREQFGVPIGSFQALKHRAAQMFCEVELSKSVVLEALSALDDNPDQVAELASLAKARLNDTYNLVSSEGSRCMVALV